MLKRNILSLFFIPLSFLLAESYAFGQEAKIVHVQGLVSVNQTGDLWEPARKEMVVPESTIVKTGDQAYCDIAFDEEGQNVASIGPNSKIKINELQGVHIIRGRVFAQLKGDNTTDFKVSTPVAIAGARGTSWESIFIETAKFSVADSTIYVQGIDQDGQPTGVIDIPVHGFLDVDAFGELGELGELSQEDIDRLNEWTSKIENGLERRRIINKGDIGKLFTKLLESEIPPEEETFASDSQEITGIITGGNGDSEAAPSITGGDISTSTFDPPPDPEPERIFTPPPNSDGPLLLLDNS